MILHLHIAEVSQKLIKKSKTFSEDSVFHVGLKAKSFRDTFLMLVNVRRNLNFIGDQIQTYFTIKESQSYQRLIQDTYF